MTEHVPSPADGLLLTARELLATIIEQGGRVHRMGGGSVFVLTQNPELARYLLELKGIAYKPRFAQPDTIYPLGSYRRHPQGQPEWDIYVHTISVRGEETIWQAAGGIKGVPTVDPADYQ